MISSRVYVFGILFDTFVDLFQLLSQRFLNAARKPTEIIDCPTLLRLTPNLSHLRTK